MQSLILLLVSALQLLNLIQAHPQLPDSFKASAIQVATEAIQTVQDSLNDGSLASSTVTTQISSSNERVAPVVVQTTAPQVGSISNPPAQTPAQATSTQQSLPQIVPAQLIVESHCGKYWNLDGCGQPDTIDAYPSGDPYHTLDSILYLVYLADKDGNSYKDFLQYPISMSPSPVSREEVSQPRSGVNGMQLVYETSDIGIKEITFSAYGFTVTKKLKVVSATQ